MLIQRSIIDLFIDLGIICPDVPQSMQYRLDVEPRGPADASPCSLDKYEEKLILGSS